MVQWSAVNRSAEKVILLIDAGAELDRVVNDETALYSAVTHENYEVARILLTRWADVNAANGLAQCRGHTVTEWAAQDGHALLARWLERAAQT